MRGLIAASLLLLPSCASLGDPTVVDRRVRGETSPGRFVDEIAYEVALTAALDDAAGRLEQAEGRYALLTRLDPASADAWSRLAATRCRRGVGRAHVDDAFARARRAEPNFSPMWARLARCQLSRGELQAANDSASRAFALEPTSPAASELLIELAKRRGDADEVTRLTLGARALGLAASPRRAETPDRRRVDGALLRGRYDDARAAARAAGLDTSTLALRAAALGRLTFARELAALTPESVDARVALYAADPTGPGMPASLEGASALALALLRQTFARRGLGDAAAALPRPPSDDPLIRALEADQ